MRSGNKTYLFFTLISLVSILSILFASPNFFNSSASKADMPIFTLQTFDYYTLQESFLSVYTTVEKAASFQDHNELDNVTLRRINDENQHETLTSTHVIHRPETLRFPNEVTFKRDDGTAFQAEDAIYLISSEILSNQGKFELTHPDMHVIGTHLKVDRKQGTITAKNIVADVEPQ